MRRTWREGLGAVVHSSRTSQAAQGPAGLQPPKAAADTAFFLQPHFEVNLSPIIVSKFARVQNNSIFLGAEENEQSSHRSHLIDERHNYPGGGPSRQ